MNEGSYANKDCATGLIDSPSTHFSARTLFSGSAVRLPAHLLA